ncbi:family 78 glycoside hydrolase catalytic domain [Paenibacillus sp. GCM10023252]|uniref:family 78 glycoside hydrolase catalytic domain n=1 Tax=Paenibacillus sp. GCM10023252 TaxID=3252649 RepID=UPI00361552B6
MTVLRIYDVKCEYKVNPIGLYVKRPRISWKLDAGERRDVVQAAYQIQASEEDSFGQLLWDSGEVSEQSSIHIAYSGAPLLSRKRYYYRIQVWDSTGASSGWSDTCYWETGIRSSAEWQADWITGELQDKDNAHYMRREVKVSRPLASARIYATALGLYRLYVNGEPIDDTLFAPGWTSYNNRLQVQAYEVTGHLADGDNVLGAMLGNGWYKGNLGWGGRTDHYGAHRALLLELHLTYTDGTEEVICSDGGWQYSSGPLLYSELYHGERYDARLERDDWCKPAGLAHSEGWSRAERIDGLGYDTLVAQENDATRMTQEIKPIAVIATPRGETVLDMGQNMVGWVRFKVRAAEGTELKLQHAEVLDLEGNFYTGNLRTAKQTITYICRGGVEESYEPIFSFQGFRYVRLEGWPEEQLDELLQSVMGCVIHTDMEPTGTFECSDEDLNQLQRNIVWGQRGNFLDVPTDCPQRDERLGWTGDAQVFIRTAAFNYGVANFFTKWLRDLAADQREDGGVPFVIPDLEGVGYGSAAWGDAAVICPWTLYECYGDTRILEEQYESMKAWVDYIRAQGDDELLWNTGFHFGDWLALDAKENSYIGATPRDLICTAFYAYSTELLAKAAAVIGKEEEAAAYRELHSLISAAFRAEFVTPNGRVASPTQTAYVLALMFDLLEEGDRPRTAAMLAANIEENKVHLTTGFVGTPYLCLVLTRFGYSDLAYKLALQKEYPSWLYSVTKGATTIWEHWDGIKPDGSFWSDDMNSYNHYAYGAIGDWFYRRVAGIDTVEDQPGYKHIRIEPQIEGPLTYARAALQTMYGEVSSSWVREGDGRVVLEVGIPANTTAEVVTPPMSALSGISHGGGVPLAVSAGIHAAQETDEQGMRITIGSGSYRFEFTLPRASEADHALTAGT